LLGIVPPLSWSDKLAASAQSWANTMASQCNMHHSGKSGVGENIAYGIYCLFFCILLFLKT
jgi:uncharacterized protein YkwD